MTEQFNSSRGMRILIGAAALVIIIAGINLAQSVVVLFLVSFFLALLGTPPVPLVKGKKYSIWICSFDRYGWNDNYYYSD